MKLGIFAKPYGGATSLVTAAAGAGATAEMGPGPASVEGIEGWLGRHGASFETAALRLPQDEAVSQCYQ
jgi:hypothetical protein